MEKTVRPEEHYTMPRVGRKQGTTQKKHAAPFFSLAFHADQGTVRADAPVAALNERGLETSPALFIQ